MKILVASGSFKDVYDPIEACEVIRQALNQDKNQVETQPICDGGEYTFDILKRYFGMSEITAENIVNTYHRKGNARYLVKGSEAHIVSSEILRLFPREDCYKNPLQLTDYGFGQLVWDALNRGYKDIILYIGGTSTVTCGMGFDATVSYKFANEGTRGFITYIKTTLKEYIKFEPQRYLIDIDGQQMEEKAFVIACCNAAQYGNNAYIAPRATMQDGLTDVTVMHPFNIVSGALIGARLFMRKLNNDHHVSIYRGKRIIIERDHDDIIHIDGDPVMSPARITFENINKGIRILVPPTLPNDV